MLPIIVIASLLAVASAQNSYQPDSIQSDVFGGNFEEQDTGNNSYGSNTNSSGGIVGDHVHVDDAVPRVSFFSYTASSSDSPAELSSAASENVSPPQLRQPVQFYSYTADENDFIVPEAERVVESMRQPSQVVLVMSSSNRPLEKHMIAMATPNTMDIYFVNNEVNIDVLADELNGIGKTGNIKPSIYFIDLNTENDVEDAPESIHLHFDSLGGSSQNFEGGAENVEDIASEATDAPASANTAAEPSDSDTLAADVDENRKTEK